jgi:hypothetical protein
MTPKITTEAKARCMAHTLQEQLEQVREDRRRVSQRNDMRDIDQMIEADFAWSTQHARLVMPIDGAE